MWQLTHSFPARLHSPSGLHRLCESGAECFLLLALPERLLAHERVRSARVVLRSPAQEAAEGDERNAAAGGAAEKGRERSANADQARWREQVSIKWQWRKHG